MTAKPALIFLPGWGYKASVWQQIAELFPDHPTVFFDWPAQIDDQTLCKAAESLPADAILIGWSLGGVLAMELCRLLPGKFRRLLLTASSPRFLEDENWPGINLTTAEAFLQSAAQSPQEHLQQFHQLVLFPGRSRHNSLFLQENAVKHHPTVTVLSHFLRIDCRISFNSLQLPVLSLAGERDAVLPPRPGDRIIKGAGHAPFLSHRTEFIRIMREFLEEPSR